MDFKYINADRRWTDDYVKLAAWYKVIVENKIIKSSTSAGKLLSERYGLNMNLKPFQKSYCIKDDILEQIEKDCGLS